MAPSHNPFGNIPDFFHNECAKLRLPLDTVTSDTAGFVQAIVGLPDQLHQVRMYFYLEGHYNYLQCFLQVLGNCSPMEAGRVANIVLKSLKESGIPLSYREMKK